MSEPIAPAGLSREEWARWVTAHTSMTVHAPAEPPVKAGVKLHAACTLLKRKADGTLVDHNDQRVMVAFPDGSELR